MSNRASAWANSTLRGPKIKIATPQKCFGYERGQSFVFCELRTILIEPMFRVEPPAGEAEAKSGQARPPNNRAIASSSEHERFKNQHKQNKTVGSNPHLRCTSQTQKRHRNNPRAPHFVSVRT